MAGKEGKSVSKVGRPSAEDKQRKLTLEGKEGKEGKRVMFRLSEESVEKEEKRRIAEVCKEIIGAELRTLVEERKSVGEELRELKERIKVHEERLGKIESKLDEIGKWLKKKEEEWKRNKEWKRIIVVVEVREVHGVWKKREKVVAREAREE